MDWSKGFSARYILTTVDPKTWTDQKEFEFTEGSIDRDSTSDLRESASITMTEKITDNECWVRIYLQARQGGSGAKVALFTGLTAFPERKLDGVRETYNIDCYSVLKPADDVILPRGYYAPAGSGAKQIKNLLNDCIPAPVYVEGTSPITTDNIVAEDGETRLTMALHILDAIGWRMRILGDGSIVICTNDNNSSLTVGINANDIIECDVTDTFNWYDTPNCFMAIHDDYGAAIARDDSPDSYLSTVRRGREVWKSETGVELSSGENIAAYAVRKLKELQNPARTIQYSRRFFEDVLLGDVVFLNYPRHNLTGKFRITSQSLSLEHGCRTKEEVESIE